MGFVLPAAVNANECSSPAAVTGATTGMFSLSLPAIFASTDSAPTRECHLGEEGKRFHPD
jgi:hypothetical protein